MSEKTKDSSSQLKSPISYKALALILGLAVAYQLYIVLTPDTDELQFTDFSYSIGALACGIVGLIIAKRYWGSEVFGRAYLSLGLGFLALFIGDMTYIYYDWVLNEDPYPSPADVFFLAFPAFAVFHLVLNIRYFKRTTDVLTSVWLIAIPVIIIGSYSYFAFVELQGYAPFDFFYGLIFVATSAVILAFAVFGASVFRASVLGTAWLLLAIGIFIYTIADVWYYYLELFGLYDGNHPTNTLWVLSFMIVVYALYKHQKVI